MSENKKTVERYMDGFRASDHEQILSCLTEDVEWILPGAFQLPPIIVVDRLIEEQEQDVVVAERLNSYLMEVR